jgi:hypothetical protein
MTIQEFFSRIWEMLIGRVNGPLTFRLVIQPAVAVFLAIRVGLRDAREGRPPYFFWSVFTHPARRPELFRLVWQDVGKVFMVAVTLDIIYELIVYRWVYPGQALIVATVLAIIPYLLIRGPITRLARRLRSS